LQLGLPYDEVVRRYEQKDPEVKKARQFGKVANFGFPGGLGYAAFVDYAYSWGIAVTEEEAKRLKQLWLAKWPEMRLYFRCVAEMAAVGEFTITQLHSGRYRGRCIYTSACNTFFQGLAADGAKDAFYHVSRACYSEREAPLYGARPVLFIHDEIGCEVPLGLDVDAAAKQLAHIMVERMQLWVPTVQITATPVAATKWSKSAERTLDERGRLIPYVVR
jgi:DNA polymerase-1